MTNIKDEGVIKFDQSDFIKTPALSEELYQDIEEWREYLFELELIGEYLPEKLGFGNLSYRNNFGHEYSSSPNQFIITGTQTGGLPSLDGNSYTRVTDFDLEKNKLSVRGPCMASSESLSHAAIYITSHDINAVFHVHHKYFWLKILESDLPRTAPGIDYGTLEMAFEMEKIAKAASLGIFAMAGHEDGVVAYGPSIEETGKLLIQTFNQMMQA